MHGLGLGWAQFRLGSIEGNGCTKTFSKGLRFKAINNRTVSLSKSPPPVSVFSKRKNQSYGITLMFFGSWFQTPFRLITLYLSRSCCFVFFFFHEIIWNKLLCTSLGIFITSKTVVFDVRKIHLSIHAFHFVLFFDLLP